MEQNTDRMWWTIGAVLLGGILIAGAILLLNTTLLPNIKTKVNDLDRSAVTMSNSNLLTGTSGPFVMGYGIPNTTWDTTNEVSKISLPVPSTRNEILPQDPGFRYTYTPGVTYTQSLYISTDAPLTGTPIKFTWFTDKYGHNTAGADNLVKVSTNIYKATSTYTWPSSNSPSAGRNADLANLTQVFDFTKGTFLQFYKPKLELGSVATTWMPSASEVE